MCSVMVLKKLGPELMDEFLATVKFLGDEEGMQVRGGGERGTPPLHWRRRPMQDSTGLMEMAIVCVSGWYIAHTLR